MSRKIFIILAGIILVSALVLAVACNSNSPANTITPSTVDPTISTPSASSSETPLNTDTPEPTKTTPTNTGASPTPSPVIRPNIIIDHTNWDWYESQTGSVFENVAGLRIFFAHASVGSNVLDGVAGLNSLDSMKYPLRQEKSGSNPPATTSDGVIYEYPRGNPGWLKKIKDFAVYIENGWNVPAVDVVMNKFCYIDQEAEWEIYRDSMIALENQYPDTRFIYWTMPVTTSGGSDTVLRSKFNQNLREWVKIRQGKVLFDIADIEAWSPDGQQQIIVSEGQDCQQLYARYTSDGGHLNDEGARRVAIGLYSLFGKLVNP